MNIEIKARLTGKLLFKTDAPSIKAALELAVKSDANLTGANLSDADLSDANLSRANLSGAYLSGAYLSDANLTGANLSDADLSGADLSDAILSDANLSYAILPDANLSDADGVKIKPASPEVAIANLDKVREIIMDNAERLDMVVWHADDKWKDRTCAEETLCKTTHCLAGWLQVCSDDKELREIDPKMAGFLAAPIAAKMFFRDGDETLDWLKERKYVAETEERQKRLEARQNKWQR